MKTAFNSAIKYVPAKKTASPRLPTRYFGFRLQRRYNVNGFKLNSYGK